MKLKLAVAALAFMAAWTQARADGVMPLAAHRAAYEITLAKGGGTQAPVSASGLIAYEFKGSSCEGYAANFRQVTELQRGEGAPISSDTRAVTFEDGQAKTLRFRIDTTLSDTPQAPIDGSKPRWSDAGNISIDLAEPKKETLDIGKDVRVSDPAYRPHFIEKWRSRAPACLEARVFSTDRTLARRFSTR